MEVALLLLLSSWGNASEAQEVTTRAASVRLTYARGRGVEACPDRAALVGQIATRLGYDPIGEPASFVLSVSIRRIGDTLIGTLRVSDAQDQQLGVRDFQSDAQDCSELVAEIALASCLAIDPLLGKAHATPAPLPAQNEVAVPLLVAKPTVVRWAAFAGATLSAGLSPAPAPGLMIGAMLRFGIAMVELDGLATLATQTSYQGGSVSASLLAAMLVPCLTFGPVGACASLLGGADEVGASNLPLARRSSVAFWALGGRLFYELPLFSSAFYLRAQADLLASLSIVSIKVGPNEVWATAPVSLTLGLGGGLSF
jgi:hypothetical protein